MNGTVPRAELAVCRPKPPPLMLIKTLQQGKRIIRIVIGFTILIAGVVMLLTPGPGLLTIAGGLAILAAEFAWARCLLKKLKERSIQVRDAIFAREQNTPPQGGAPSPKSSEPGADPAKQNPPDESK